MSEIEKNILDLNKDAMDFLRSNNYSPSASCLKTAENIIKAQPKTESVLKLRAITLNNFGCLYKRKKQPNVALKYLRKAVRFERIPPVNHINLAGTHLNICAIYSEMGKHQQALDEGTQALELIKQHPEPMSESTLTTLIIAYHNTAVEYEFLYKLEEAIECYKAAWDTAKEGLESGHALTDRMHKSYIEALGKAKTAKKRPKIMPPPRPAVATAVPKQINRAKPRLKSAAVPERRTRIFENTPKGDLFQARFITGDRLKPMFPSSAVRIVPSKYMNSSVGRFDSRLNPITNVSAAPRLFTTAEQFDKPRKMSVDINYRAKTSSQRIRKRPDKQMAVGVIQRAFRRLAAKHLCKRERQKQKYYEFDRNTIKTLSVMEARKHLKHLQAALRGLTVRNYIREREQAATVIQKYFRGHQCKEIYKDVREAILYIQRTFRALRHK